LVEHAGAFLAELRYSLRRLWSNPLFVIIATVSVTLGVGAVLSTFSLINLVFLRSITASSPEQLAEIGYTDSKDWRDKFSYNTFVSFGLAQNGLSSLFAFADLGALTSTHDTTTETISGMAASHEMFATLGIQPILGRAPLPSEDSSFGPNVVLISHDYWIRSFGANHNICGSVITLNTRSFVVIGVLPRGFRGMSLGERPDVVVSVSSLAALFDSSERLRGQGPFIFRLVGRRQSGVSDPQVATKLGPLFRESLESDITKFPPSLQTDLRLYFRNTRFGVRSAMKGGASPLRKELLIPLVILGSLVAMLLAAVCGNLSILFLIRAESRKSEATLRLALGCPRLYLLLPWLVESVTVAFVGMILGCFLAWRAAPVLLVGLADISIARTIDFNSLREFAGPGLALTLVCAILAILPCLVRVLSLTADSATKGLGRAAKSPTFGVILLSSQVVVSVLLSTSAVLFVESLLNLQRVHSGYDENNHLLFSIDPQLSGYKGGRLMTFYDDVERRLNAIPGVRSATGFRYSPGHHHGATYLDLLDGSVIQTADREVGQNLVGSGFARTLGMTLLEGRDIGSQDAANGPLVVVINEAFARKYFGRHSPIGQRISFIWTKGKYYEIVGVVGDARDAGLHQPITPMAYLAYRQNPSNPGPLTFVIRTDIMPRSIIPSARQELARTDPTVAITDLQTLHDSLQEPLFKDRVLAFTAVMLAVLATGLVSLGIFALLSNIITNRTREIGIQIALGASSSDVVRSVSKGILLATATGTIVGAGASFLISKYLRATLFGLQGYPMIGAALLSTAVLLVVAGSSFFPLIRAIRIDPATALRYE
jgi:putative ABC transport system permease protein